MEISSFFGLPAHPMLVHLPVVLIPLTALVAVLAVVWAPRRLPLSMLTAGMAIVGAIGAILAAGSGEALQERLSEDSSLVDTHAEIGEQLRLLAVLMAAAAIAYAIHRRAVARGGDGKGLGAKPVFAVTATALLLTAGLATAWTVRTGHSGAKAVWSKEWNRATPGGGERNDEDHGSVTAPSATGSLTGTRPAGG